MVFTAVILLLASLSVVLSGCGKEENDNEAYRSASRDNTTAEAMYADVFTQMDQGARQADDEIYSPGEAKSGIFDGGCVTLTITPFDTLNWPKTITVDFGEENCLCEDGKYRRGILEGVLTGRYKDSLSNLTIVPEDYYVNDHHVEGVKSVTNLGHVSDGKMTFAVLVTDGKIIRPDGGELFWESERTRIWLEGEVTPWPAVNDDVYLIAGSAQGTTAGGLAFSIISINPLRLERDCEWITSGTLLIQPEGKTSATLDYGDGTCDNQATVTFAGFTIEIGLP
jgi:hypothetical protein